MTGAIRCFSRRSYINASVKCNYSLALIGGKLSRGFRLFSTNETDRKERTVIVLKVSLNILIPNPWMTINTRKFTIISGTFDPSGPHGFVLLNIIFLCSVL